MWWDLPYYDQHVHDYCTAVLLDNRGKPLTEHVTRCWEFLFGDV